MLIICSRYTFSTTFLCRFFNIRLCFQLFGNILFPCVSNGLFLCLWNSRGRKRAIFSCFRCGYGRLLLDTVFDFCGFVLFYVISLCFDGICGFISRLAFLFLCLYVYFFGLNLCCSLRLSISPPSRYFLRFLSLYIFSSAYRIISSMVLLYFSLYGA